MNTLSDSALSLFRRRLSGERVEVNGQNRPFYRELAEAGMMIPLHTFLGGDESACRLTEEARILRINGQPEPIPTREGSPSRVG